VSFACALMSKPMAVTMPALLLLLDWWPLQRFHPTDSTTATSSPRLLLEKLPFLMLSLISSGVTLLAQQHSGNLRSVARFPITERTANTLISYAEYALKTVWPSGLCVYYPYHTFPIWTVLAATCVFVGAGVLAWKVRRCYPYVTFGWLWYVITLLPVIGLVQVGGQSHADRYTYIPLVGLFVAFIWGCENLTRLWVSRLWPLSIASAILLIFCLIATHRQLAYWRNNETLYRRALAVTTGNYVALNNLGVALLRQERLDEALPLFRQAVDVAPRFGLAHLGLADVLAARGLNQEALIHYQTSLQLAPNHVDTCVRMGTVLTHERRFDDARMLFNRALSVDPGSPQAHCGLGVLFATQERFDEAIQQFRAALLSGPEYRAARLNLASTLGRKGSYEEAIRELRELLKSDPTDAELHCDLGDALAFSGQIEEAEGQYGEAIRLAPLNARAHGRMGDILSKRGYTEAAAAQYRKAIQLDPKFEEAKNNLQKLLPKVQNEK